MTGTRIIGPALAAVLIATVGISPAFLLNGLSYLAVIGGLVAMRPEELHRTSVPRPRRGQLREGLAYVRRTPELLLPLAWMAVIFTFSFNFSVLFPLLAVMGVGSLAGALAMARQKRPNPRRLAYAAVGFGLVMVLAALAPSYRWELAALVPFGLVSMVFMITGNSTLQLTARPEMRGRVMALYGIVFLGGTPIGAFVVGWVAQHFGPRMGLGLGAVAAIATGLAGVFTLARLRARAGKREAERVPALVPANVEEGVRA